MRPIDFLLLLSLLTSIGCQREDKLKSKIRIAVPKNLNYALLWIAKEKNFIRKSEIDVEFFAEEDPASLYQNRKVDLICSHLTEPILLHSEGINTEIIYRFTYTSGNDVLITKPKIKNLNELRNKKISFHGVNSSSHIFIEEILDKNGIKEGEYNTKNLKPQDVLSEIQKDNIQAGLTQIRYLKNKSADEYRVLARSSELPDLITDVMSGRTAFLRAHKIEIKKLIASLLEAREFCEANPKECKEILSKVFGESLDSISAEFDSLRFLSREENIQSLGTSKNESIDPFAIKENRVGIGQEKRGALFHASETIVQFLSTRGQLYKNPDLNQLIVNDYLKDKSIDENSK